MAEIKKPLLVFQAPVATRSGYGDHARDLVRSLISLDKYDIIINTVTLQQEQDQEQLQPLIKCNRQIQQLTSTPLFQHQRYNINQMIDLEKNPLTIKLIMGLTQCITIPGSPIDNMWFNYSGKKHHIVVSLRRVVEV